MSTIGARWIAAMVGADIRDWFKYGRIRHLFEDDPQALKAYDFMDAYARKNNVVPSAKTVQEAAGFMMPKEPGEAPFLFDQLRERRVKKQIILTGEELQQLLANNDPVGALKIMHERSKQLMGEVATPKTFDFKDSNTVLWSWLTEKWSGKKPSVPFPWPTLDSMTGGVYGGEFVSTIGRPGKGKTWLQLLMAYHAWLTLREPIVFSSQEMMARKIMERLAALHTRIGIDIMKDGLGGDFFGKDIKTELKNGLIQLHNSDLPPFVIIDGSLASQVGDIVSVCRSVQPCAAFVDGAYLLKPPPEKRFSKGFEKIEFVCEALKQDVATDLDLPVFASWQFNRDSTKAKAGQEGLEHIAGGDTIGQISSIVLGLVGDTNDDNPESIAKRRIKFMKGRDGEIGDIDMHWDFATMNLGEVKVSDFEDNGQMWGLD